MDLATIIGLLAAFGLVVAGIMLGSPLMTFFDLPSVVIVVFGCIALMFVSFPASKVFLAAKAAKTAFLTRISHPQETIKVLADLSRRARREGLLSLESAADETRQEEKYVVINVLGEIHGQPLLESLLSLGFAYGDMNIFHCQDENGVVQFSLTNAVEPGSFDLEKIQELVTPGVTLFMCAHELEQPLECFHQMLNAGSRLAEDLGSQLCDETRSEMTVQGIEDRRQNLQEYQDRRAS